MNSHSFNSLIHSEHQRAGSTVAEVFGFLLLPVIVGSAIDVGFTQSIGSQHCSFTETEFTCTIAGKKMPAWVRELSRFILQISVLIIFIVLLKSHIRGYESFIGILGSGAFMMTQSGLFEDFRRFINSIIFLAKYHK